MATIRARHLAGLTGEDVLIDVASRGITLSFAAPPSEAELAEAIDVCERRMLAEIAAETLTEQEECDV